MNRKSIQKWLSTPFTLLDPLRSRVALIVFCAVFGCFFLNLFRPFNLNEWFTHANQPLFVVLTFFCAAGLAAGVLSQLAIRSFLQKNYTSRLDFFIWSTVDFIFIAMAVHIVNHFVTRDPLFDFREYAKTLTNTFLILVLPYSLGLVLLFLREQLNTVEELKLKMNENQKPKLVEIKDENGKLVMSIDTKRILYIKSEDNYVLVFYKLEDQVKKELIRTSLKRLEQELDTESFVRIHRSYIINTLNLVTAKKNSGGYQVVIDPALRATLPVTDTYQSVFEERCLSKAS